MQKVDWINSLERRYHRISEWLRWEGTSGGHFGPWAVNHCSSRATSSSWQRTMCTCLLSVFKDEDSISPWRNCVSAQSPSQGKSVSCCSERTSCVSVCSCCLWFITPIPRKWAVQESDGRRKKYKFGWKIMDKIWGYHLSTAQKSGTKKVKPQGLWMK